MSQQCCTCTIEIENKNQVEPQDDQTWVIKVLEKDICPCEAAIVIVQARNPPPLPPPPSSHQTFYIEGASAPIENIHMHM